MIEIDFIVDYIYTHIYSIEKNVIALLLNFNITFNNKRCYYDFKYGKDSVMLLGKSEMIIKRQKDVSDPVLHLFMLRI